MQHYQEAKLTKKNILLGEFLLEQGLITEEQLSQALTYHNENGVKLGRAFIELKILEEKEIIKNLSTQLGVQYINLKNYRFDEDVLEYISPEIAWNYFVFPLFRLHNRLSVAMVNPLDIYALDELTRATKLKVEPVIAMEADILEALQKHYPQEMPEPQLSNNPPVANPDFPVTVVEQGHEQDNLLSQIDSLLKKLVDKQVYKAIVVADKLRIFNAAGTKNWDLPEKMTASNFIRMICNLGDDMYPGGRGPKRFQIEKEINNKIVRFHLFSSSASQYQGLSFHIQMERPDLSANPDCTQFKNFSAMKLPAGVTILSSADEFSLNDSYYSLLNRAKQEFQNPLSIETKPTHLLPDVLQLTCIQRNEQASALQFAELSGVDCLFLKDIRDSYTLTHAVNLAESGTAVVIAFQASNPWELFRSILYDAAKIRLAHQLRQIYINYPLNRVFKDKPDFLTNDKETIDSNPDLSKKAALLESVWIRENSESHGDEELIFEQASSVLRKKLREEVTKLHTSPIES
ncbi:MAG: hypothetical protein DWQ05_08550 [Calditrichaeota bacterium]|nr:MAG: hypothetical protein DWQ05_08550 [Calditrichota bacterium]